MHLPPFCGGTTASTISVNKRNSFPHPILPTVRIFAQCVFASNWAVFRVQSVFSSSVNLSSLYHAPMSTIVSKLGCCETIHDVDSISSVFSCEQPQIKQYRKCVLQINIAVECVSIVQCCMAILCHYCQQLTVLVIKQFGKTKVAVWCCIIVCSIMHTVYCL